MTDREALAAALAEEQARALRGTFVTGIPEEFITAARERLAQLPEKCKVCQGRGTVLSEAKIWQTCKACPDGSGKVYPAELVGRVVKAIDDYWESAARRESGVKLHIENLAVAVLDALNETE